MAGGGSCDAGREMTEAMSEAMSEPVADPAWTTDDDVDVPGWRVDEHDGMQLDREDRSALRRVP